MKGIELTFSEVFCYSWFFVSIALSRRLLVETGSTPIMLNLNSCLMASRVYSFAVSMTKLNRRTPLSNAWTSTVTVPYKPSTVEIFLHSLKKDHHLSIDDMSWCQARSLLSSSFKQESLNLMSLRSFILTASQSLSFMLMTPGALAPILSCLHLNELDQSFSRCFFCAFQFWNCLNKASSRVICSSWRRLSSSTCSSIKMEGVFSTDSAY